MANPWHSSRLSSKTKLTHALQVPNALAHMPKVPKKCLKPNAQGLALSDTMCVCVCVSGNPTKCVFQLLHALSQEGSDVDQAIDLGATRTSQISRPCSCHQIFRNHRIFDGCCSAFTSPNSWSLKVATESSHNAKPKRKMRHMTSHGSLFASYSTLNSDLAQTWIGVSYLLVTSGKGQSGDVLISVHPKHDCEVKVSFTSLQESACLILVPKT